MFRPLLNRAEFYHQPDDDLPSWPSPSDDFASPQARRLEKLIETAREKQQEKPQ